MRVSLRVRVTIHHRTHTYAQGRKPSQGNRKTKINPSTTVTRHYGELHMTTYPQKRSVLRRFVTPFALIAMAASTGCSGGGGSSPTPPGTTISTTPGANTAAQAKSGLIAFTYLVPATANTVKTQSLSAKSLKPLYVSASTFQAAIVVTPQGLPAQAVQIIPCTASANGAKTCSGSISAPAGVDSVAITLEDQPIAGATRGNALSTGVVAAVINAGTTTTIHATLDGIVKNVTIGFASKSVAYAPSLPYDGATQGIQTVATYAVVNALDVDGNIITANGGYVDAAGANVSIGLSASNLCGGGCSVNLGITSVSGPGAIIPVVATLDDSKSKFNELLSVTPSILFGNPGGTLSAASTTFVRPTSCTAYLPKYLPTDFDMTVSGNQIVIRDNAILDPRLALAAQVDFDSNSQGSNFPVGFVAPSFGTASALFSPATGSVSTLSATYSAVSPASLTIQSSLTPTTTVNASIAVIGDGSLCTGATNPAFLAGVTKRSGIKPIVISGIFTEYHIPNTNQFTAGITSNPDGNLYVTAQNPDAIYKVTTSGVFQSFTTPPLGVQRFPNAITTGPDGALWYGHDQQTGPIGRMTTSGSFVDYAVPSSGGGTIKGITSGPDGNVWYTNTGAGIIGKITPTGQSTEYPLPRGVNSIPAGVVTGPDGNLWVAEQGGNPTYIAKVTPQGVVTEYILPSGSCPSPPVPPPVPGPTPAPVLVPCAASTREIAVGPDGALWLTDATNGIDRVTTSGQVSTYPLTNSNQVGKITKGPDGNMWFTHGNLIGTITMSGSISEKTTPSGVFIQGITTGPDNAIWYVGGTVVGKIK